MAMWPWKLGLLVGPNVTYARKQIIVGELWRVCDHVDPFTLQFRRSLHSPDDALSEASLAYLSDVFDGIPVTNIVSEAAFAGINTRSRSSHGNEEEPATLSAKHVLAAAKSLFDAAAAARPQVALEPARAKSNRSGRATGPPIALGHSGPGRSGLEETR
eukprot:3466521-Pyramimonas_sp.AAC.1